MDGTRADGGDSVYDAVEFAELSRDLATALSTLPERERQIMLHRFGFIGDGAEKATYVKLAPMYGVSAERIRQIERNVLGKLRGPNFGYLAGHLATSVAGEADPGGAPVDEDESRWRWRKQR